MYRVRALQSNLPKDFSRNFSNLKVSRISQSQGCSKERRWGEREVVEDLSFQNLSGSQRMIGKLTM